MWDTIVELGKIVGPSALTALLMMKGFIAYLEKRDAREEQTDKEERSQLLSLLEKQTSSSQQVAILNEKVALVLNKLLSNGGKN